MLRDVRRGNTNTKRTKKDDKEENDPTLNEGATGGVGLLHGDAE